MRGNIIGFRVKIKAGRDQHKIDRQNHIQSGVSKIRSAGVYGHLQKACMLHQKPQEEEGNCKLIDEKLPACHLSDKETIKSFLKIMVEIFPGISQEKFDA